MSRANGGVTTTYSGYDALNRIRGKSYSDNRTFSVAYGYDSPPNGVGRLASVTATDPTNGKVYKTSYDSYDAIGRVLQSPQTTADASGPFVFSYLYNVGGELEQVAYPSNRKLQTCYSAAGRISSVKNQGSSIPYANIDSYAPHGAPKQITFGGALIETSTFNKYPTRKSDRGAEHRGNFRLP